MRVESGPQAGGVFGWTDERGNSDFVYGEATGYFLTAMAHLHATNPGETVARMRAQRTFDWLEAAFEASSAPSTYSGIHFHVSDWRNAAIFSFDLAMMLQAVSTARGLVPELRRRRLATSIVKLLAGFVSGESGA